MGNNCCCRFITASFVVIGDSCATVNDDDRITEGEVEVSVTEKRSDGDDG
jgi:hypothetical protein